MALGSFVGGGAIEDGMCRAGGSGRLVRLSYFNRLIRSEVVLRGKKFLTSRGGGYATALLKKHGG